jgi:hypothetical protein
MTPRALGALLAGLASILVGVLLSCAPSPARAIPGPHPTPSPSPGPCPSGGTRC